MGSMDDSDHNTLPAVVVAHPALRTNRAGQGLTRWASGRLPDWLRSASRHPAVVGSLATAAGVLLDVGLRWAFRSPGQSDVVSPSSHGESLIQFRRTVVVETWTVRGRPN